MMPTWSLFVQAMLAPCCNTKQGCPATAPPCAPYQHGSTTIGLFYAPVTMIPNPKSKLIKPLSLPPKPKKQQPKKKKPRSPLISELMDQIRAPVLKKPESDYKGAANVNPCPGQPSACKPSKQRPPAHVVDVDLDTAKDLSHRTVSVALKDNPLAPLLMPGPIDRPPPKKQPKKKNAVAGGSGKKPQPAKPTSGAPAKRASGGKAAAVPPAPSANAAKPVSSSNPSAPAPVAAKPAQPAKKTPPAKNTATPTQPANPPPKPSKPTAPKKKPSKPTPPKKALKGKDRIKEGIIKRQAVKAAQAKRDAAAKRKFDAKLAQLKAQAKAKRKDQSKTMGERASALTAKVHKQSKAISQQGKLRHECVHALLHTRAFIDRLPMLIELQCVRWLIFVLI